MAGLSYKPLSYTELSTYQLLCIKDVYQLIDTICADKYADWNIIDFEKAVVSNKYPNSYDEQSVRTAIESSLLRLDSEKPRKRYLEQGKHYAYELFLYLPEQFRFDEQPYKLFWAYMAREFSNNELPIEKKQFRERYIAVLKKFNMRLYSNRTLYVKRFSVKTRYGEQMELEERDICFHCRTVCGYIGTRHRNMFGIIPRTPSLYHPLSSIRLRREQNLTRNSKNFFGLQLIKTAGAIPPFYLLCGYRIWTLPVLQVPTYTCQNQT